MINRHTLVTLVMSQAVFTNGERPYKKDAFTDVSTGIDVSLNAVSEISDRMTQMDTARRNVVDTVPSLSAIAEENAASTEECSASVSSITAIAGSIEDTSKELHEIADGLNADIGKFTY